MSGNNRSGQKREPEVAKYVEEVVVEQTDDYEAFYS